MTDWITTDQVKLALSIPEDDTSDDAWLQLCVDGVNRLISDTRQSPYDGYVTYNGEQVPYRWVDGVQEIYWDAGDCGQVDGRVVWGGVQLATRWYARRNSSDISAFVEMGGPPPSIDRDIEIALKLNRYFGPVVA